MNNLGVVDHIDQSIVAQPGDIVYCKEDRQIYVYFDEGLGKPFGWRPYEIDKTQMINLGMTEYEINKMVVTQLPSLITETQLRDAKELIREYTHNHITSVGYYMLLCNDLHSYTVFEVCDEYEEKVEDIVLECLQNIGVIQQVNKSEVDNAIECWIKNDKGAFMFLLFDYEWGVITCQ